MHAINFDIFIRYQKGGVGIIDYRNNLIRTYFIPSQRTCLVSSSEAFLSVLTTYYEHADRVATPLFRTYGVRSGRLERRRLGVWTYD
jgi:hypothetical protein